MSPREFVDDLSRLTPQQRRTIRIEAGRAGYSTLPPDLGKALSAIRSVRGGQATLLAVIGAIEDDQMAAAYRIAAMLPADMLEGAPQDERPRFLS